VIYNVLVLLEIWYRSLFTQTDIFTAGLLQNELRMLELVTLTIHKYICDEIKASSGAFLHLKS